MAEFNTLAVEEPTDLVKFCINEFVFIKLRHGRELRGKLHAFDTHLNCLLSDVEESGLIEFTDPKTNKKETKIQKRKMPMLYIRGDTIILVAPKPKQ